MSAAPLPGRKGYFVIFDSLAEAEGRTGAAKRQAVFRYRGEPRRYERLFDTIYNISFDERWISFGGHILPASLIQLDEIKEVLAKVVDQYGVEVFTYCSSKGMPQLRKQLSLSLGEEGIKATPGEIVIINETFQGLEYVVKLLAEKNDYVVTESPVMPDVLRIFAMQGLNVLTVPLEEDGANLTQLENLIRKYQPRFFSYHAGLPCDYWRPHESEKTLQPAEAGAPVQSATDRGEMVFGDKFHGRGDPISVRFR